MQRSKLSDDQWQAVYIIIAGLPLVAKYTLGHFDVVKVHPQLSICQAKLYTHSKKV